MFFLRNGTTELFIGATMACIDAIIADHLEIGFRDVSDQSFHEIQYGNGLVNKFVVFVPVVVKGNRVTVIFINA